jgi:hypothetical protein
VGRGRRSIRIAIALAVVGSIAAVAVPGASALAFADQPCVEQFSPDYHLMCPSGTLGVQYSVQLTPKADSGNGPPYTFLLKAGSLPAGLQLSSSGLISGVPSATGTTKFGVELQDNPGGCAGCGCVNRTPPTCAYRDFRITIAPALSIDNQSVPPGTLGQAYSQTLTATQLVTLNPRTGPQVVAAWSVQSGALPPGISLSPQGILAGTPTAEGTFQFVVNAQNGSGSDVETLTIVVRQPLVITAAKPFATAPVPTLWEVGVPFSSKLTPSGGTGTYTFAIASGSLPTGLALAADGSVSGTPRRAGVYRATLRLSDSEGRTLDYAANFGVAAKLAVSTPLLKPGKVGKLYRSRVASTGGVLPKAWKITAGKLPKGVKFDRKLGLLSGTPTKAGRYRLTFQVTDGLKVVAKKTLRIDVLP